MIADFNKAGIAKKLSKEEMKSVQGGKWVCGCLDGEDNFYPGNSGANYCWTMYQAEPWCVWR